MDGGVTLLSGKKLRPYNKPLKHTIMAGGFAVIDFNAMLLEWVACGVLGIIRGLVSVVWDIIVLVKDVVIGVFDLLLFVATWFPAARREALDGLPSRISSRHYFQRLAIPSRLSTNSGKN